MVEATAKVHYSCVWTAGVGNSYSTRPPESRAVASLKDAHREIGDLATTILMFGYKKPDPMLMTGMLCTNAGILRRVEAYLPQFRGLYSSPFEYGGLSPRSYHDFALDVGGAFVKRVYGLCLPNDWDSLSDSECRAKTVEAATGPQWDRLREIYASDFNVEWDRLIELMKSEYGKAADNEAAELRTERTLSVPAAHCNDPVEFFARLNSGIGSDFTAAFDQAAADTDRRHFLQLHHKLRKSTVEVLKSLYSKQPGDGAKIEHAAKSLHLLDVASIIRQPDPAKPAPLSPDLYCVLQRARDGRTVREFERPFGSWLEVLDHVVIRTTRALSSFLPGLHAYGASEELARIVDDVSLEKTTAAGRMVTMENVAARLAEIHRRHCDGDPHLDPNDVTAAVEGLRSIFMIESPVEVAEATKWTIVRSDAVWRTVFQEANDGKPISGRTWTNWKSNQLASFIHADSSPPRFLRCCTHLPRDYSDGKVYVRAPTARRKTSRRK